MCGAVLAVVMAMLVLHGVTANPVLRIVFHRGQTLEESVVSEKVEPTVHRDFTEINKGLCPPSLCKHFRDSIPEQPQGTAGSVFFQGDIVLDKQLRNAIFSSKKAIRSRRAVTGEKSRHWPKGVVIFQMDSNIDTKSERALLAAMSHIADKTCIRFREKTPKDKDYILYISEPGCWAQVGRIGGEQLVNIGEGCETLGTATHEILHALGLWHEQTRPDRDHYVRIMFDNIQDEYLMEFEIVNDASATTLQHAYDYGSLMHYTKFAYNKTEQPTIEVIGIGEALGLSIGQRLGLSDLDIAQLREMYGCNARFEENQDVCPAGWTKHQKSCYMFFDQTKVTFNEGHNVCKTLKAHLLILNDIEEQKFVAKYSNQNYKGVPSWRTAGKLVNGQMVWFINETASLPIPDYADWSTSHPGNYTSVILAKDKETEKFRWMGEWAETSSDGDEYKHPFICETATKRKCEKSIYPDGRDYRGALDHTQEGFTCQRWTESYPYNHSLVTYSREWAYNQGGTSPDGLGNHNKCRNPDGLRRSQPWCYTTKVDQPWGFCDIKVCDGPAGQLSSTPDPTTDVPTTPFVAPISPAPVAPQRAAPIVNHPARKQKIPKKPKKKPALKAKKKCEKIQKPSSPKHNRGSSGHGKHHHGSSSQHHGHGKHHHKVHAKPHQSSRKRSHRRRSK